MKKIGKFAFNLALLVNLLSCWDNDIVYQGHTRFLYSLDGQQNTWSETVREITVGTTYYVAIKITLSYY